MSNSPASSSTCPPTVAINYDNEDNPRDKLSDIVDNDTSNNDGSNDGSDNDGSNVDKETEDTVFFCAARDIMNQAGGKAGTEAIEGCRFCSFFEVWFDIVCMVWDMLGEGGMCPEKSEPKHLRWALYF